MASEIRYDDTLNDSIYDEGIVREFNEGELHPKNYHEIPDQLFDLIKENI